MLIFIRNTHTHTRIPQLWLKTLYCTELSLTLLLLWKLWADLTLIEVSCSWWGAVAWDVLQMYHEWCISNYSEAKWNVMMERREATGEKQKKRNKKSSEAEGTTISINLLFSALLQAFAPIHTQELKWVQHWCWVRRSWLAVDDQVWVRVGSLYLFSIPRVCLRNPVATIKCWLYVSAMYGYVSFVYFIRIPSTFLQYVW